MAIVGYGPSARLRRTSGQLGLKVVVVERDPDLFAGQGHLHRRGGCAHLAIGRAGGPVHADMETVDGIDFVDAAGVSLVRPVPSQANGHPPQQFIYQPGCQRSCGKGWPGSPTSECCSITNACVLSSASTTSSSCWRTGS